jgi:hypothetical protein
VKAIVVVVCIVTLTIKLKVEITVPGVACVSSILTIVSRLSGVNCLVICQVHINFMLLFFKLMILLSITLVHGELLIILHLLLLEILLELLLNLSDLVLINLHRSHVLICKVGNI